MEDIVNLMLLENLEIAENQQHIRIARNPRSAFDIMNEKAFIKTFRLSKDLTNTLINILEPFMIPRGRPTDLDIRSKVLIALNFFATGSHQTGIGENKYLDVSQSSVSRSISEVVEALNQPQIFNEWVRMPRNMEELNGIRLKFYREHGFPGVVGCIDCTHVAIVRPRTNDPEYPEHLYVNRKNYHSINVQLICDSDLLILNVCAKYPGSTNDAYIWGRSNAQDYFRNLHAGGHKDYFLLGDSGYPLRSWLLTPLNGDYNPGTPEYNYNRSHKNTRVKIECCNGVLKNRFRCLLQYRTLYSSPARACKIINACVVLHNMCIKNKIPEPEGEGNEFLDFGLMQGIDGEEIIEEDQMGRVNAELVEGRAARRRVIYQNFR